MIQNKGRHYAVSCDECGEEMDTGIVSVRHNFGGLIDHIKAQLWTIRKTTDGWRHICPECQE